jgi:MoaA/NifB/PqqE/SkfB family radical SAM enzyme
MLASPRRPLLVQLVVTRRCNLSCGYCSDATTCRAGTVEVLEQRIDHIAKLGTLVLTLTGGEPLLHPKLDHLIARAVSHGMVVTTISNGYPLTKSGSAA